MERSARGCEAVRPKLTKSLPRHTERRGFLREPPFFPVLPREGRGQIRIADMHSTRAGEVRFFPALPEEGASGRPLGKHMADEAGERGMSFSRAAGRGLSGRRSEEGISQEEDGGTGRDGRFFFRPEKGAPGRPIFAFFSPQIRAAGENGPTSLKK